MQDNDERIGPLELGPPGSTPKLSQERVQWARKLYQKGFSVVEITDDLNNNDEEFTVSRQTVADAITGRGAYKEE